MVKQTHFIIIFSTFYGLDFHLFIILSLFLFYFLATVLDIWTMSFRGSSKDTKKINCWKFDQNDLSRSDILGAELDL